MKKLLVSFFAFLAVASTAFAAVKTVTWSLPANWEGTLDLDQICEPVGAPSMPYYNALVEVPSTATNFAITASGVTYRTSDKARPTPVLEPSIVGEPANAPVEDALLYAGIFPSDVFEQGEPWEMNGKTYLPVRIKVYRWNGPAAKVEALDSLTLSIACSSPRPTLKLTTSSVPTAKVDYIVISPHSYVDYWKPFIEYRKTTHPDLSFQIVDANEIYNAYTSGDHQLRIHHFIEDMHELGTKYILLGAGAPHSGYNQNTMIPIRSCVTYNGNTQSCDFYYCVMDYKGGKEVWDYNGDGIYLASKNSSGGYTADSTSQFTWQGAIMVHRFPARDTVTLGGKSKSAKEQIEGYVKKLQRAEQGLFDGRFSQAILGHQRSSGSDTAQGNTSTDVTMEREFYDLGANIFSEAHGTAIAGIELDTRARAYNYMTVHRPVGYNRSVLQFYYKNNETASDFYGRNFDAMLINAHGSPETVEPIEYAGVFNSKGLSVFHIMCCPCHAGNPCSGGNTEVSIAEAGVVNPDGGSLVTFANSASGWYGGRDVMSQKIEVNLVRSLYGHISNLGFQNAGEARLYAQNNYGYAPSPRNANGQCLANGMAYGDPLVSLSPIWSRKVTSDGKWWYNTDYATPCEQEFASALTIEAGTADNEMTITNAIGAATLTVNGASGKTLTLKASGNGKFKVSNSVTVNNGMTLNWEVPGGFGRNGINLSGGGNLRLRADGYYGTDFRNIGDLSVAPSSGTAVIDFDSKSYFRNGNGYFKTMKVEGPGETIFRSRQAGIFSTDFSIPVTGGTLTLETPCVGGSGAQSSTTPLFAVTNATLAVRPNPNWTAECFSRRVIFENGTLASRYDKFYLGANVSGYPGLDISVGGTNSVFTGTSPIRLNGQLRIHTATGGVLNVTGEFVNGNGTGSIAIDEGVTLKLAGVNTFSGGVTVPDGARLVVDHARGLGTGNIVVQSGGVLQMNAMPLVGVSSVTLQSGAKLVLKSTGSGGSYQMYSPSTTAFSMADDVKVYDASDETKELDGIVTPEGAYFISDAAKYWANLANTTWTTDSSVRAWLKKGVDDPMAYTNGDTVLFKNVADADKVTVAVSGDVAPGMMAFQNTETPYAFTGNGTITVGSMATAGTTSFEPSIKATSQLSVGGMTTVGNVTTPTLNVAGGGKLNMTGTVNGIDTVRVIQFKITKVVGFRNATPREHAPEMSDLRFYDKNNTQLYLPVGTTVKDSCGSTCTISGKNASTGAHTFSATSGSIYKLFDQDCGTYHMIGSSITGPWTVTITMPEGTPMEMFAKFAYGRAQKRTSSNIWYQIEVGDYPDANPMSWVMYAGDSESSLKQFASKTDWIDATVSSLTGYFTSSSWTSSSKTAVQNGGAIYLNGTYNVPVTVNAGATLAITNTSKVTFGGTKSWPSGTYAMTVDATQAKKTNGWFQVTQNAGLSSLWSFQTDDETVVDVKSGELWVATAGVMAPPYSRTLSADGNWNTTDWKNGKDTPFDKAWGSTITKPTGTATLNVTGTNLTMSVDCAVALDTLTITTPTNCFPQTLTVKANGGSANISAIDLRTFNGFVDWQPTLASWGCNVYAGTNSVQISAMTAGTGKLQVGEGGKAIVPQKFASYDIDQNAYVRFTGSHSFAMSDIPTKGCLSFADATLSGSFQNSLITYIVEKDDKLVFTGDGNNYNGRISSSFDMRGGAVTIKSNGASTWFGINGDTTYNQTGGVFTCTANGTGTSGTGNGLLLGYSETKTEDFEFNISGGRFEVPSSSINFFGPVRFLLVTNGVVQAKGVMKSGGNKGTITVNHGTVFELGSIGLVDGACDFNLYGGILAGFENGARTRSAFNVVGLGTLAAKENTTLTVDGAINADSATLNFGTADYTGTVKLESMPDGVTNITVTAGTWDMGSYRTSCLVPGASCPILSKLDGYIAAQLTDDELRTAAQGGLVLFRTTLKTTDVESRLKVVTSSGTEVPATGKVENGNLILSVSYVYPLYATIPPTSYQLPTTSFDQLAWSDAIGMPFHGEWSDVTGIVLSNALEDVTVVIVTNAFTKNIALVNTGTLELIRAGRAATPTIAAIDDSASTGTTTLDLTANNVTVGAKTVIKKAVTGTTTIGKDKTVVFADGVELGTYSIVAGGTIRYEGTRSQTCYDATVGVYNNYEHAFISVPQKSGRDNDTWFKCTDGDYLRAMGEYTTAINALGWNVLVTGGEFHFATNAVGQATWYGRNGRTFTQTGGKTVVETHDTTHGFFVNYAGTSPAGVLTMNISGGLFDCSETLFKFGKASAATINVSGGEMRVLGLRKDNSDTTVGGTVNLTGGRFSMGASGIEANIATLNLSGGEFHAFDTAALNGAFSVANTVRMTVATNKTLSVNAVPTGSGTLVCEPEEGATIALCSGDWSNVKLDGAFSIRLQSGQELSNVNVVLFTPAREDMDLTKITVLKSDGSAIDGAVHLYNGKVTFVPANAYAMPAKATIVADTNFWDVVWYDASSPAKTVAATNICTCSDVWLEVAANATFTVNSAQTIPALRIYGDHTLSFAKYSTSKLTLTSASVETDVIAAEGAVAFTSVNVAEGKTLEIASASDVSAVTGTGRVKLTSDGRNYTGLDLSKLGNSASTIELSGTIATTSGSTYLANTDCSIGTLDISGSVTLNDGFSARTYSFAKLVGTGALTHTIKTQTPQTFKLAFTDASEFAGALSTTGAQIGIGANPTYANGTIAVAGKATIATDKQWYAKNGITVQSGGELNIPYGTARTTPTTSALTVEAGGYLNLCGLPGTSAPTEYEVSTSSLTINGGLKLNGEVVRKDAYSVTDGTITLKNISASGASVSLNIIGGAGSNRTGLKISDTNYAGVVPVTGANWNQAAQHTTTAAFKDYANNLKEVLSDGTVINGPMKATMVGSTTYTAGVTANNGDAQLMYGYIDDGSTSYGGATIIVDNIPYAQYDVYVYVGGDHTTTSESFRPITVTAGGKSTTCPSGSNWGSAGATHGTVTLTQNTNYVKVEGCTGSQLKVVGGKKSGTVRGGIAGIQIFNTGTRINEMTWKGATSGGIWDKEAANWSSAASSSTTWNEISDGINIATFTNDTSLTLGEKVSPDVLNINDGGILTVANAANFGKAFIVSNGVLRVTANELTQDVTLAAGAKIDILTTSIATDYVVTKGKVRVGGDVLTNPQGYIRFNGAELDAGEWTFENGTLKRVVKPGTTPFSYTIAENGTTPWTNAPWLASNLFYVRPEEWTTNTVSEADLTVSAGVTNTLIANANISISNLVVNNSGVLTITNGQHNLSVAILDDSSSTGATLLGFAPTNVIAGADTILASPVAGTLTVDAGMKATVRAAGDVGPYEEGRFDVSSGGEIRFETDGTAIASQAKGGGAVVSYSEAKLDVGGAEFWWLKLYDGDHVTLDSAAFVNPIVVTGGELVLTNSGDDAKIWYGGNKDEDTLIHSRFDVKGGRVTVRTTGCGTDADHCGFLIGQTSWGAEHAVLTIDGGDFAVPDGRFTFWENSAVIVSNGTLAAKGISKHNTNHASSLSVGAGGIVEVGSLGFTTENADALTTTFNGGTLRAADDATISAPLHFCTTNTLSAASGKTLVVSSAIADAGDLKIGEQDWPGTVVLSNATALTGTIAVNYGTLIIPTNALAANLVIGKNGVLDLCGLPGTSTPTEFAITSGAIAFGEGASVTNNITVNGAALGGDGTWSVEGGKIVFTPTPPKHFTATVEENDYFDWSTYEHLYADFSTIKWNEGSFENAKRNDATLGVKGLVYVYFDEPLTLSKLTLEGIADDYYAGYHTVDIYQFDKVALADVGQLVITNMSSMAWTEALPLGCDIEFAANSGLTVWTETGDTNIVLTTGVITGVNKDHIWIDGETPAQAGWKWNDAGNGFVKLTGPRILDGSGEIAVNPTNATEYIVSTNNVKAQITVEGAGDHTIVVPPAVTNVVGVAPEKIKVRHGDYDITDAFSKTGEASAGVVLALDPNGKVKVPGEESEVTVVPALATVAGDDHVAESPFVVTDGKVAVGVKAIPGLTYKLMRGTEIGTYGHEAASARAETSRISLKDGSKSAEKAFYIISVSP